MKKSYEIFKKKAGLTTEEAYVFLALKIEEATKNEKEEPVNMEFIENISEEARKWKKMNYKF